MQSFGLFFRGVFIGKRHHYKFNRLTIEALVHEVLTKISDSDEGIFRIYKINLLTNEKRFIKKIHIANELFLSKEESLKEHIHFQFG